jgi:hypothetical protein
MRARDRAARGGADSEEERKQGLWRMVAWGRGCLVAER